jgi:hypothetical protein
MNAVKSERNNLTIYSKYCTIIIHLPVYSVRGIVIVMMMAVMYLIYSHQLSTVGGIRE